MAIKKAKNGQMLEYMTIKIKGGFSAQEIAALALLETQYNDKKKKKLLSKKMGYQSIINLAKESIIDTGCGCIWERFSDSDCTDEDLQQVVTQLIGLSGGKLNKTVEAA